MAKTFPFNFSSSELYNYDPEHIRVANGVMKLTKNYKNPQNIAYRIVPTDTIGSGNTANLEKITNGDTNSYAVLDTKGGNTYITIDLGEIKTLNKIKVWGLFFRSGRIYQDRIVAISETGGGNKEEWTVVYNNDTDNSMGMGTGYNASYQESADGKEFFVNDLNARYVRVWTGVSNQDPDRGEIVEVEVYETTYQKSPRCLKTKEIIVANVLNDLKLNMASSGGGDIRLNLIVDDNLMWFDGIEWSVIDDVDWTALEKMDYYRSNELSDIIGNWGYFIETGCPRKFQFLLWIMSTDGSRSPEIDSLVLEFDIDMNSLPKPQIRKCYGYIYDQDGKPSEGIAINAHLAGVNHYSLRYSDNMNTNAVLTVSDLKTITDEFGHYEFSLVPTDKMNNSNAYWAIQASSGYKVNIKVPSGSAPLDIGDPRNTC